MEEMKILVPLDFSDLGIKALHSAKRLAELFEGSITPFHSYLPMPDGGEEPYMFGEATSAHWEGYEAIEQSIHQQLDELAHEEVTPSLLTPPRISMGNPAQAIVEEAANFDLIVMTTHGRTGFSRFFLGSVAEKVLRTSHIPVLIVNKEREFADLNRMMLTTDLSEHSFEAFPWAQEIAQKTQATLEVVNVITANKNDKTSSSIKEREQKLQQIVSDKLGEVSSQVEINVFRSSKSPHEAILDYNLEHPHDLIVMSSVGHTGIEYLMMGSTTANVVRHVKSPVLSVNPKQPRDE